MSELTVETVEVSLGGGRSYPVVIGEGLLDALGEHCRRAELGRRALVVADETVAPLFSARVSASLAAAGFSASQAVIAVGEEAKRLETVASIYDACVEAGLDRGSFIVAVGGGVVGDLAGFAAATYMRGIAYVQAPTTLLAQVDSSVGGKTGVNHPRGKNLIGAFHQPSLVVADVGALRSLARRDYRSGLAEVVKAGLIADQDLFEICEARARELTAGDSEVLTPVIARSVAMKARVVEADEREEGLRAILNFGHTVGHAIEAAAGYGRYTHGEAVAIGMVVEGRLSVMLGMLPEEDLRRAASLIARLGLPVRAEGIDPVRLLDAMAKDKKARDGSLRFALLEAIGKARVVDEVAVEAVLEAFRWHECSAEAFAKGREEA